MGISTLILFHAFSQNSDFSFDHSLSGGKDCESIERRNEVGALVSLTNPVNIDKDIVEKSGEFIRKYDVEVPDAIVAASAFDSKATIVTRNIKDYEKIKEVRVKKPY